MIFREAIQYLKTFGRRFEKDRIEKLITGIHFTAVQLTGGGCGMARTEIKSGFPSISKAEWRKNPFAPGRLRGQRILDILTCEDERSVPGYLKLAVLNACSSRVLAESGHPVISGRDPVEWLDTSKGKEIVLVGAFQSYMEKLSPMPCRLRVLELDPDVFPEGHKHLYVPAKQAGDILPFVDGVLLTGSTMVNRTLDALLSFTGSQTFIAIAGPSAGLFPDLLFSKGIHLIGTIRVFDADRMFNIIAEGGAGCHLYGDCAEKICIINGKSNHPLLQKKA